MNAKARDQLYLVLAILFSIGALFTVCYPPLCLILGSMAVLFGELSKGDRVSPNLSGIIASVIGWVSIAMTLLFLVLAIYMILFDPATKAATKDLLNQTFTETYGFSFEDYIHLLEENTGIEIHY